MDGLTLTAVVRELGSIVGGRVEKVQQPERDELLLSLHTAGGSCRLLISASPENCRITLTDERKQSPAEAPAFLMLMRKYLTGARITGVEQPNGDRIVKIGFETYTELHDAVPVTLVCEIMGRVSNIILVDSDGNVIDSIRRVSPSVSSARLILPKVQYEYPPSKQKRDARNADADAFAEVIKNAVKPESALCDAFYGLSPAVAKRFLEAVGWPECGEQAAAEAFVGFYSRLYDGKCDACVVLSGGKTVCTLPFLPEAGTEYKRYASMSEAVNAFYSQRAQDESIKRRTSTYERAVKNAMQKLERKLGIYSEAITGEEEIEKLRVYGELLTANLHSIPQHANSAFVLDYYSDPPASVEIPMDPIYSAPDNAQRYYTKYRKAKLAREYALEMQRKVTDELDYLDGILYTLGCCDGDAELNELRAELIAGHYIKDETRAKGKNGKRPSQQNKQPESKPMSFVSRDGITILVGKNNRQNDRLTLHSAEPENTWLHTKDIHGSHVIIKHTGEAPEATLFDAAVLAAYYSKARGSANVPVDYTLVKYVKKPSGASPGMVTYTHQHTVYVTPDSALVLELAKKRL